VKSLELFFPEGSHFMIGADARLKTNFVSILIPDTCDSLLVEQKTF
tara:strand:+ start:878 stop:1015 length:138 start_codon:yes stop_codon:yes gene_type:complete